MSLDRKTGWRDWKRGRRAGWLWYVANREGRDRRRKTACRIGDCDSHQFGRLRLHLGNALYAIDPSLAKTRSGLTQNLVEL